ncbi:hypothetical protein QTO30_12770 [Yoonia sp. GPGPB17]|uniref:hypothetical protein n=1 Tax=Yoonia sp. GPGPB17 TaxID=3026147 RepID=UPI0030C3E53E
MKRLMPIVVALMLTGTTSFALEQEITIVDPTVAQGATVVVNNAIYFAYAAGILTFVAVVASGDESGSSTTTTN